MPGGILEFAFSLTCWSEPGHEWDAGSVPDSEIERQLHPQRARFHYAVAHSLVAALELAPTP